MNAVRFGKVFIVEGNDRHETEYKLWNIRDEPKGYGEMPWQSPAVGRFRAFGVSGADATALDEQTEAAFQSNGLPRDHYDTYSKVKEKELYKYVLAHLQHD